MSRRVRGLIAALAVILGVESSTFADVGTERVAVGVEVRGDAAAAELVIRGEFTEPSYAIRSRDGGSVVVVDIAGATLPAGAVDATGSAALVSRTTASTTSRGVRLEVGLSHPSAYRARVENGNIVVRFESNADAAQPASAEAAPAAVAETGPASIRGIHLERRDGRERVVVELSRPAQFRFSPGQAGRLEIPSARLDASAETRIAGDSESLIRGVRARRDGDRVVLEVDRAEGTSATAIREGSRIVWLFAPAQSDSPERPRSRVVTRERVQPNEDDEIQQGDEVAGFLSDVPLQVQANRGSRRYSGRRIDLLDFKDADIHNILRLLAEVGGVNIVTGDDVTGSVTIRMTNVPWDQALDVILQAKGLGMIRRGNLLRVAPLTTLEKEREMAIARRKQTIELSPLETRIVPVSYASASDIQSRVRELLSGRGSVSVDERTNVLITRDVVENLDDIEELVRSLDTQTPQVLVEARIVEATSQYTRDVGIQWGGDVTMNSATGNPTGLVFPSNIGIAGGNQDPNTPTGGLSPFQSNVAAPNFGVNLPATTGTGVGGALGLTLGSIGGNVNLAVRLSASEANGNLRIISSPRILTLDNHEAHIAQGTLIPYSQVSAQGVQTAFQEAKLELRVRPHVTSDGSVSMHVKITRDEPDFTRTSPRGDPTILKREAETDLLIQDGHTAVIGGIYTRTAGRNRDQIPFFGDIPILGVLFQRRRVRDERSELLIFLTPRIVNRSETMTQ